MAPPTSGRGSDNGVLRGSQESSLITSAFTGERGGGPVNPARAVVPMHQAGPCFLPPFLTPRALGILSKESPLSPETPHPG